MLKSMKQSETHHNSRVIGAMKEIDFQGKGDFTICFIVTAGAGSDVQGQRVLQDFTQDSLT